MKIDKTIIGSFILLVVIASLYRVMPGRPFGFAPQIAMSLFAGSVIKDRKFAFLLPLLSMFLSDCIYQMLFSSGLTSIAGFYEGQWLNYLLFGVLTVIGFWIRKGNIVHIIGGSLVGATCYFLLSNFIVWAGGGLDINNLPYPKTVSGLATCYSAGLLFYKMSIYATLFFNGVLFGGYYLFNKYWFKGSVVANSLS
jgi:hypothetical protein